MLRLALFVGLALFAAVLLYRGEDTRTRVVKVEREQVNACVDSHPRACRSLLNRLLTYATPHQRQRIRRAQVERAQVLASPTVTRAPAPPKREAKRPPATINPPHRPNRPVPKPAPPAPSPAPVSPAPPAGPTGPAERVPQPVRDRLCDLKLGLPICPTP